MNCIVCVRSTEMRKRLDKGCDCVGPQVLIPDCMHRRESKGLVGTAVLFGQSFTPGTTLARCLAADSLAPNPTPTPNPELASTASHAAIASPPNDLDE